MLIRGGLGIHRPESIAWDGVSTAALRRICVCLAGGPRGGVALQVLVSSSTGTREWLRRYCRRDVSSHHARTTRLRLRGVRRGSRVMLWSEQCPAGSARCAGRCRSSAGASRTRDAHRARERSVTASPPLFWVPVPTFARSRDCLATLRYRPINATPQSMQIGCRGPMRRPLREPGTAAAPALFGPLRSLRR